MSEPILIKPHFADLIDTPHLLADNERLPGRNGEMGKGLKVKEAIQNVEVWWDTKARFMMPDYGKDPHEQVIRSGVMMGLPWFNLNKQEMLRVLAQWYAHVGVHLIIEGKSTSQDGEVAVMDDLREDGKDMFEVLNTESTHEKTALGDDDSKETTEWKEEYEQLEAEEKLVDAQGEELKTKGETNG